MLVHGLVHEIYILHTGLVCSRIAAASATGGAAFNTQAAADGDDTKAPAGVPSPQGEANS